MGQKKGNPIPSYQNQGYESLRPNDRTNRNLGTSNLEIVATKANSIDVLLISSSLESTLGTKAGKTSNSFVGNQTITGNVDISGKLTVNELVTQYETSSVLFTTGSTKMGDQSTDKHEFTGSTNINGPVYGNIVAQSVVSNTASLDFSSTNIFTITLGSNVTTHISASNVRAGQAINLLITTGTNSTASFSTNVKQPSGSAYLPTSGSGFNDILSFVTFDANNVYVAGINKFI
jgi:hypothetical protein